MPHYTLAGWLIRIQGAIRADCARHCIRGLAGFGHGFRDFQHQEAVEKGTTGTAHTAGGQHQALPGVPNHLLEEMPGDHAATEACQAQDQVNQDETQGAAALGGAEGPQGHDPDQNAEKPPHSPFSAAAP